MSPYDPQELALINRVSASPYWHEWSQQPEPTSLEEEQRHNEWRDRIFAEQDFLGQVITNHRRIADWPAEAKAIWQRALTALPQED